MIQVVQNLSLLVNYILKGRYPRCYEQLLTGHIMNQVQVTFHHMHKIKRKHAPV